MTGTIQDSSRSRGESFAGGLEREKSHRSKARSLKPLAYLWPFIARYPYWLAAFLIFLTLSTLTTLSLPPVIKIIIDCGFGTSQTTAQICQIVKIGQNSDLSPYFKLAIGVAILFSLVGSLRFYFITLLGQRVIADIRQAVYSHLVNLSPDFYESLRTGELLSRLTTDTTLIETVVTGSISFAIRSIAMIIGACILMLIVSWQLTLLVFAIGPLIIGPVIVIGRRIRLLSRNSQDALAGASARASESLSAIRTVQAFNRTTFEKQLFHDAVELTFNTHKKRIIAQSILTALIFMIALCSITGILWFGAYSVNQGWLSGGDIAAFTFYAFLSLSSAGALTETWTNLLRAAGASERLIEILNARSNILSSPHAIRCTRARGELRFSNVNFTYPTRTGTSILKNISFTIKPNSTTALVGPSGAGKSTLFSLLLRFFDPQSGQIELDGRALKDYDLTSLRAQFSIVAQDTPLFSGSALENIRYGRLDASDSDIIAAAKAAYADSFIRNLPQSYDTDLGERAMTLSGGQRQRISIARAILRDAPILLLDEATSALDAESEQAVQNAVAQLSVGRTTLVIAHRLATVRRADHIIVMDEGQITEAGNHKTLSQKGGLYARLAELQFNPDS